MKLFRIWCEWDIGAEYLVFKTEESAMAWCLQNSRLEELTEEGPSTVQDLIDECLLGFQELDIIE